MKRCISAGLVSSATLVMAAPPPTSPRPKPSEPPPVSAVSPAPPASGEVYRYDHRNWGEGPQQLVTAEQAQAIVDKFKAAAGQLNASRILVFVNRSLVDEQSGLRIVARTEKTESTRVRSPGEAAAKTNATNTVENGRRETQRVENENRYRVHDQQDSSLTDKLTTREIEQVFGRPFRAAGSTLADQTVARQLLGDKPLDPFKVQTEGETARKDREVISKIADVAIEVLVSSRTVTVPGLTADQTYTVPDIQATAIRLNDSRIIGQASSADIIGKNPPLSVLRMADARSVTEAVALALMEDMLTSAK